MSTDLVDVVSDIERQLSPAYSFLKSITRINRLTRSALRSWVAQQFGGTSDREMVSREVSTTAVELRLAGASLKERAIKLLCNIKGIKRAKASALWSHFGSLEAIATATVEELDEVRGISRELAELIVSYFQVKHHEFNYE